MHIIPCTVSIHELVCLLGGYSKNIQRFIKLSLWKNYAVFWGISHGSSSPFFRHSEKYQWIGSDLQETHIQWENLWFPVKFPFQSIRMFRHKKYTYLYMHMIWTLILQLLRRSRPSRHLLRGSSHRSCESRAVRTEAASPALCDPNGAG